MVQLMQSSTHNVDSRYCWLTCKLHLTYKLDLQSKTKDNTHITFQHDMWIDISKFNIWVQQAPIFIESNHCHNEIYITMKCPQTTWSIHCWVLTLIEYDHFMIFYDIATNSLP